jgi:hypothetical protein
MQTTEIAPVLAHLFSELVDGVTDSRGGFMLNTGDVGLLRSLERLSASDASASVHDGATIAAHVRHVQFGLSLMNRWAREGGNPFANAAWDDAWKTTSVTEAEWKSIRGGLAEQTGHWVEVLRAPREAGLAELNGLVGSIAHVAYHLGAIRQIDKGTRGPREGTFTA